MSPPGFGPAGATGPGQVPDGPRAPGEWTLSRWRVTRGGAAEACAEVAVSLTRLGAAVEDRAHAVAAMWDTLRSRLPTSVTLSLTSDERDLTGVLAVGEEIVATMRLAGAPAAPARVSADGQFQGPAEVTPVLLDIIAGQDIALDHHRQELERADRGLLALHAELAGQAEQLALSGQRQQELLATEQGARAGAEAAREAAEAARARLAFLSHVGAVLGASLDHRQVVSRLSTLLVPRYAGTAAVWLADDHGGLERHRAAGGAQLDPGRGDRSAGCRGDRSAGHRPPGPPDAPDAEAPGRARQSRSGHRAGRAARLARHRARCARGDPAEPSVRS